jgi:hypothetical protein
MHKITLFFGSMLLKHGRHIDYWNQPLNMRMRVCYLDSHQAGLCCYLVIHIENLLHSIQLFYFRLCPVYWLSLVGIGFEILTMVVMNSAVFWNVTRCSLVESYWHSGGMFCPYRQGRRFIRVSYICFYREAGGSMFLEAPSLLWTSTRLHSVTSQKIVLLKQWHMCLRLSHFWRRMQLYFCI